MTKAQQFLTKYDKPIMFTWLILCVLAIAYFVISPSWISVSFIVMLTIIFLWISWIVYPKESQLFQIGVTLLFLKIGISLVIIAFLFGYYSTFHEYKESEILKHSTVYCYEIKGINSSFDLIGMSPDNQLQYLGNEKEIGFKFLDNNKTGYVKKEVLLLKTWFDNTLTKHSFTYVKSCDE